MNISVLWYTPSDKSLSHYHLRQYDEASYIAVNAKVFRYYFQFNTMRPEQKDDHTVTMFSNKFYNMKLYFASYFTQVCLNSQQESIWVQGAQKHDLDPTGCISFRHLSSTRFNSSLSGRNGCNLADDIQDLHWFWQAWIWFPLYFSIHTNSIH